jgi:hypothetical protein
MEEVMAGKSNGTDYSELYDSRLNLHDETEVRFWARELRVTEGELKRAAAKAGTGIEAVKNELRRKSSLRT